MAGPIDADTVVHVPSEAPWLTAAPSTGLGTLAQSPAHALRLEEVARTRALIRMGWALSAVTAASLAVFDGNPILERAMLVGLTIGAIVSTLFYRHLRNPDNLTPRKNVAFAAMVACVAQIAVVYFGVFSAVTMIVLLGVYFFSRTERPTAALVVYAIGVIPHAVVASAIAAGIIVDPGLFPAAPLPPLQMALVIVLIHSAFLMAFAIARSARKSTLEAIDNLQRAMRLADKREAQLAEVRHDLNRALRIGGPGHYTGHVIAGYRVGALIGHGAMGEVYDAVPEGGGEPAAVKLLHPHVLDDRRHVERFLREMRAASSVDSPHVVRVFDSSSADATVPYLVMERLRGYDLAQYLREEGQLPLGRVCELVREIGGVIDQVWAHGIVHRDLKPQNLFHADVGGRRIWKVLDFGVAVLAESGGTLTQGAVVGTPSYMAPEQARGRPVDVRADLYALAAIAYRCLTGRPPFVGPDVPSILYDVVHTMPACPSGLAPMPDDVDLVFAIALAKDPGERFASGAALADAFAAAAAGTLSPDLREQAARLLRVHPWDSER